MSHCQRLPRAKNGFFYVGYGVPTMKHVFRMPGEPCRCTFIQKSIHLLLTSTLKSSFATGATIVCKIKPWKFALVDFLRTWQDTAWIRCALTVTGKRKNGKLAKVKSTHLVTGDTGKSWQSIGKFGRLSSHDWTSPAHQWWTDKQMKSRAVCVRSGGLYFFANLDQWPLFQQCPDISRS